MLFYAVLDRLAPRSYLAKVLLAASVFGLGPVVAVVVAEQANVLPPVPFWAVLAVGTVAGILGLVLSLRAVLRPVAHLERALSAYTDGRRAAPPLPDGHSDELGRLMALSNALIETMETRLDDARRLADVDPLTGLMNRRGVERALSSRPGGGADGALMLIDADHFKQVNDRHGHDAGDAVLRDLGALLQRQLRRQDVAARFGGEEFLVWIGGLGRARALQVAERLRMAAEDGLRAGPGAPAVTISIGLALWQESEGFQDVMKRADKAVYAAKTAGRNRIVMATEPVAKSRRRGTRTAQAGGAPA